MSRDIKGFPLRSGPFCVAEAPWLAVMSWSFFPWLRQLFFFLGGDEISHLESVTDTLDTNVCLDESWLLVFFFRG